MALLKKIGDEFSKRVCLNVYVRNIVFDSRFPFSPKRETITCTKDGRSLSSHSNSVGNTMWNYLHFFYKKKSSYSSLQVARVVQKDEQFVKFLKIYDAAVNGTLDAKDFHAGCDGKGPTLCIFRLGNGFVLQK